MWQDATYAIRTIGRNPGFAAAMILVMALGIGATTAIFGLIDGLVLRSLPVRQPERLVYLSSPSFSYPFVLEVRARASHILPQMFAWILERMNVEWTQEIVPSGVLMASGEFYSTLGVQAAIGRTFTAEDDRIGGGPHGRVAVISHDAWQRWRTRTSSKSHQRKLFTVVGVTPRGFFGVAPGLAQADSLTVLHDDESLRATPWLHVMTGRRPHPPAGYAPRSERLAIDLTSARSPIMHLSRTTSLTSARAGYSRVRNQFEEPLWLLFALVALLLAVATTSAANLLFARTSSRACEFAGRLAIGAGRARIVRQMLTEAFVWTILGSAAGLLLASWGAGTLVKTMTTWEQPIVLASEPGWRAAAFVLTLTFLTSAVCAIAPALRATRVDAARR